MMFNRNFLFNLILLLCVGGNLACAVEILWEEPVTVDSPDILLVPDSQFVHAGSWGHSGNGTVTVVVGGENIVFNGSADPELSINDGGGLNADVTCGGENANGEYWAGTTNNAEFDTVLKSFAWDGPNPKVLTLHGLVVGQGYHIQLFVGDTRGCCSGRTQLWSDNAARDAGNESATFSHRDSVCVMGTFVADAQTVEIYGHGVGQGQNLLNCYQLRKAGKVETAVVIAPQDGIEDLPRDGVVLEWSPGAFAVENDVYLGTDFDDVNEATVDSLGIYKDRVTESAYALDRLTLGETYFWRIDGINDANANSPWKGAVWSFEVEPEGYPVDVALLTATASGSIGVGPEVVVNGAGLSAEGTHDTDSENNMWMTSASTPGEGWLQIDMNEPAKLAGLHIWNHNSTNEKGLIAALHMGVKDVLIEYSLDGETWVNAGEVTLAQAPGEANYKGEMVSLGNVYAKSVKLSIQSGYGLLGYAGLSEVQLLAVPTVAREMAPAEGSTVNPVDVVLSWRAGREAASHQVYLSTDVNAVLDETAPMVEVTEPILAPAVDMARTYYWKVVEVNDLESPSRWAGPVQSFVTASNIVVDDMESYPTKDELQIWQAWADGYENSNQDNGSIVGDATGLPEKTIVYQGSQSLNMQYGVNSQPDSWATHTFDPAEDWTKHNIRSLSLKVYGETSNQLNEFYVLVNNTRHVYEGAIDDLKAGQWITFTINLQNVTKVQTLTIGVKGGSGQLYIDDIRLYPKVSEMISPVTPSNDVLTARYTFEGNYKDTSGNNRNGTAVGGASITNDAERGQVLSLNGTDACVNLGSSGGPNQGFNPAASFTVCAWMNASDWASNWAHVIMGNRGENGVGWQVRRRDNSSLTFTVRGTGGGDDPSGKTDIGAFLNQWIQVTAVYDAENGQRLVYINGFLDMAIEDSGVATPTTHNVYIGARANSANNAQEAFFNGMLDDVRFYNRALTQAEALSLAGHTSSVYKAL